MLSVTNPEDIDWANMPVKELLQGNALDSFVTYSLIDKIAVPNSAQQVSVLLSHCIPIFTDMEYNGLDVDVDLLKKTSERLTKDINDLKATFDTFSFVQDFLKNNTDEIEEFNINSSKVLNSFFGYFKKCYALDILDASDIDKSAKTEKYSFNEVNLIKLKSFLDDGIKVLLKGKSTLNGWKNNGGHSTQIDSFTEVSQIVTNILKLRTYLKLSESYIQSSLDIIDKIGINKLFCNYNLTGTVTGRLSCGAMVFNKQKYGVSMHTLPRSEEYNMRDVIVPNPEEVKDDYIFVAVDYSAMELRVMAQACKDFELVNAFKTGTDLHTVTAAKTFKVDNLEDVTKEQRQTGKMVNFLTLYGGGPKKLAEELNISYMEAKKIIRDYHLAFPSIDEYKSRVIADLRKNNETTSLFGRVRHLEYPYKEITDKFDKFRVERQAMNSIIQGTASDILLVTLVDLDRFFKENKVNARLVATVHDSIEFVIKTEDFFHHFQEITSLFHNPDFRRAGLDTLYEYQVGGMLIPTSIDNWEIPLQIDFEVGKSFGSNIGLHFEDIEGTYNITNPKEVVNYLSNLK